MAKKDLRLQILDKIQRRVKAEIKYYIEGKGKDKSCAKTALAKAKEQAVEIENWIEELEKL